VTERRTVEVPTPSYGWDHPWPNAFEIARVFRSGHAADLVVVDQVLVDNLVAKEVVPGRSLRIPYAA
jgi:hypothetical protein